MTERTASLAIYRPIYGVTETEIADLEELFWDEAVGLSDKAMQSVVFNARTTYSASVISSGELIGFHKAHDLPVDEAAIGRLALYLDEVLPSQVDHSVLIPSFPAVIYSPGDHRRKMCLGAGITPAMTERRIAQQAMHNYYQLDVPIETTWHDYESQQRLSIVESRHFHTDSIMREITRLLTVYGDIFPPAIEYGPLELVDVRRG